MAFLVRDGVASGGMKMLNALSRDAMKPQLACADFGFWENQNKPTRANHRRDADSTLLEKKEQFCTAKPFSYHRDGQLFHIPPPSRGSKL